MGTDLIQKVAVVGDDDHRVGKAEEELFQPGDGIQIEMVGRLIEQQDIGVAEKGLSQQHPHLVPGLQFLHVFVAQRLGDAEPVEQYRRFRFGLVTVHLGEFRLQFAGADAVGFAEIPLGIKGLALAHHLKQALMPHDHGIEDGVLVEGELVLAQHRNALAGADGNLPLVGLGLAGENLEKGRFPRAVGADQAIAVAGGELDVYVLEDDALAVGESDVAGADHAGVLG